MKRVRFGLLIILLFVLFVGKVNATFTTEGIAKVASNGKITEDYKNEHPEYKNFKIEANAKEETGTIFMSLSRDILDDDGNVTGTESFNIGLMYYYDSNKNIYIASETLDKDGQAEDNYFLYNELYSLFPFWCVEASYKWNNDIEPLFDNETSKLNQLRAIFDKCYMSEYGVCYTIESSSLAGTTTYISKAEVSDKSANYVISKLKENRRDKKQQQFLKKLAFVFVILVFLYALAMSYKKQFANEEYAKKRANYKQIEIVSQKK